MNRRTLIAALTGVAACSLAAAAAAQTPDDYPNRPIRIIVTQAAGSGVDQQARVLAQKMGELWGQQGVVENRPGANAIIGMEAGAKAAPDGYTLIYASVSALAMNNFIYKKLPYDPVRDFVPITQTVVNPMGAVVNPASGLKSIKDIVERAKANPGHLNYDVLSGQIPLAFTTTAGATELADSGKLTLLATFGRERDEQFPNTPTPTEFGYPSVVIEGWAGLFAPAGTPPHIINRLHGAMVKVLASPDVKDAILRQGSKAVSSSSPAEFERYIRSESQKFQPVIKAAGLEGSQ
jgi:tripartite-type tricarboxylate transporter receptor subunit TctC